MSCAFSWQSLLCGAVAGALHGNMTLPGLVRSHASTLWPMSGSPALPYLSQHPPGFIAGVRTGTRRRKARKHDPGIATPSKARRQRGRRARFL